MGYLTPKPSAVFSGDLEAVVGRRFRWFELSFPVQVGLSFMAPKAKPEDFDKNCDDEGSFSYECPYGGYDLWSSFWVTFHLNLIFHLGKRVALTAFGGANFTMELGKKKKVDPGGHTEMTWVGMVYPIAGIYLTFKW